MKAYKSIIWLSLFGAASTLSVGLHAWSPNGHRTLAAIAQRHLNAEAASRVADLLEGENLVDVANWADSIKSVPEWGCAEPFHYSTIPLGTNYFEAGVPPEGDSIGAIVYFEAILSDQSVSRRRRQAALKFLIHIIGDMHQPLHVGLGCDRGGNNVVVSWFDEPTNLHRVWDRHLFESAEYSFSEFADSLERKFPSSSSSLTTPLEWAIDSQKLFREVYRCDTRRDRCACVCGDCGDGYSTFGGCEERPCQLRFSGPIRLGWEYKYRNLKVVEQQLAAGGKRLASFLNSILGSQPFSDEYRAMKTELKNQLNWEGAFQSCLAESPLH